MKLLFRKYKTYPIIYSMQKHKSKNPETIDELVAELESANQTIKSELSNLIDDEVPQIKNHNTHPTDNDQRQINNNKKRDEL